MGADDSVRKLKRKKNTNKKNKESSAMGNFQLAEIEEDSFQANKKKKSKKSSDPIANKEDIKIFELSNINANGTREITGRNKKSKRLRNNKRKTGKIAKTGIAESGTLDSNEVEDRTFGKKDVANEASEDKLQNPRKKKRKNNESVKKAAEFKEEEDTSEQQNDEEMAWATQSGPKDHMASSEGLDEVDASRSCKTGKSKKAKKKKKSPFLANKLSQDNLLEKRGEAAEDEVYQMSSGDEDYSKGMKKWIMQYHQSRPGIKVLQERIDDFITAHEAQEEKARKEREAQAEEGGWTVVVHHKGRKKTTDAESGIAVGSVAQAAVLDKMAKKKNKEVGLDFYRFQRKEAHRNEIMMLQSQFEQDKKRIQQMRAARKFRPY